MRLTAVPLARPSLRDRARPAPASVHPAAPVRARFAPSPTGFLHLGSLRTALYNYLLARSTGGTFILRLEDTDQSRLVPGAEANLYESLAWAGIEIDEGPVRGGPYGPYRQSERLPIYRAHADQLVDSGHAYRCFCPKHRLDALRDSARALQPPSMASYDRKCFYLPPAEAAARAAAGEPHTIRFKAPEPYPVVTDLLHGRIELQTQTNPHDVRFDDPVLFKSDGFPTYHLASVVDDHLMAITHVIRGEEWIPSTPKHLALYAAFGWTPPQFTHIPLLTTLADKKLSKRSGDTGIRSYAAAGVLPEALVNFVALYGWSPKAARPTELYSLAELAAAFSLDGLTKGNAKVSDQKLAFFNAHYLQQRLATASGRAEAVARAAELARAAFPAAPAALFEPDYVARLVAVFAPALTAINDLPAAAAYVYGPPELAAGPAAKYVGRLDASGRATAAAVLDELAAWAAAQPVVAAAAVDDQIAALAGRHRVKPAVVFGAVRFALAGSVPGAPLGALAALFAPATVAARARTAAAVLRS
ncbi:uncharacterized protein V1510DRAFT_418928 [Dipodascopsis tothii]|uniref:uncharacterized protein n=1 Tax=Dipodascopsis tothii TaxID=44089 RepID=UPI0034CECA8E